MLSQPFALFRTNNLEFFFYLKLTTRFCIARPCSPPPPDRENDPNYCPPVCDDFNYHLEVINTDNFDIRNDLDLDPPSYLSAISVGTYGKK